MQKKHLSARVTRIMLATGAAALLAACSSDIERLSDYPPIDKTASVAPGKVESKPLAPAGGTSPWNSPTPSWARSQNNYAAPVRTAYNGTQPAYTPPAEPSRPAYTPPAQPRAATSGTIIVQPGQTLYSIARANGKTVQELMAANGLSSPELRVGQRLVIPGVANPVSPAPTVRRTAYTAPAPAQAAPAYRPRASVQPAAAPARPATNVSSVRTHRVQPGETWYALGRKYHVHPRKIAAYNGLSLSSGLKVGQVVKIPPSDGWSMPGAARSTTVAAGSSPSHAVVPPRQQRMAQAQPQRQPQHAKDQDRITDEPAAHQPGQERRLAQTSPVNKKAATGAGFIWPVQGRVIAKFGKTKNGRNEGINIAAPEGAPVRAAADGVVAYAGNELKDYGNLILIRHKGGWVTAYAHNKELKVKRGDHVRQGQVIATVGRTGAVKTPQLHFELRKGATPVDPLAHLGTATAMR